MRIASIDIGTNTVLLLVAELDIDKGIFETIENRYEIPRIGRGLKPDEPIAQDRIEALYNILNGYKEVIVNYNCEKALLTATNAMRIASNGEQIVNGIKNKFGWDVNIITGDEEARISFLGASSVIHDEGYKTVIDIGGGSTEIIYGSEEKIEYKKSFRIGAVSLTEMFFTNASPTNEEIKKAEVYLEYLFNELKEGVPKNINAIAVAGTPTSLSCMVQGLTEYVEEKVEASRLTQGQLERQFQKLLKQTPEEILNKYGKVVTGREDVMTGGALILFTLMRIMDLQSVTVSGKGIRYGAVIDYMNAKAQ